MAQTGRSNVRYVDPRRRYTVVLGHHGTPLSERCPTTTALEYTTVPMDNADRMPPLGAVKPQQKFFDDIHRGCSPLGIRHERRGRHAEQQKNLASPGPSIARKHHRIGEDQVGGLLRCGIPARLTTASGSIVRITAAQHWQPFTPVSRH